MTEKDTQMDIPLYKVHIPSNIAGLIADVISSGQISAGPYNLRFEDMLRKYLGNPFVIGTSDISNSLVLCLFLAGVRPGDEVLMSPLVCLATSCPVHNLFANIKWCDVDPMTGIIDPEDIIKKITPKTKAIIVYHWAGNPADLDEIQSVARAHNIAIIEDAGEAFGAEYHGKKIGNTGSDYTVFSFYPNRHITTIDGSAIACKREEDFEQAQWLKRYGIHQPTFRCPDGEINPSSDIPVAGWNNYMSQVAATIGVAQMEHINQIITTHQDNGLFYDKALSDIPGVTVLKRPANSCSAYWVYTFLAQDRERLIKRLREEGVHASKVHLRNDIYTCFGPYREDLPGVDCFSEHCLSIPCGWWVSDEDRQFIVSVISK